MMPQWALLARTFMWGALSMSSLVASLYFARFWRRTHERLFVFFALAFFVLCIQWIALAVVDPANESRHWVFVLRLVAFASLIYGVVDRNRRS